MCTWSGVDCRTTADKTGSENPEKENNYGDFVPSKSAFPRPEIALDRIMAPATIAGIFGNNFLMEGCRDAGESG
jgi:hypothetical protein